MEENGRLLSRIVADLGRIGLHGTALDTIVGLIRAHANLPKPETPPKPGYAQIARSFYRSSLMRTEALGGRIVADGAWNMLLDLFAAAEEDNHVSVSSACIASGGAHTTALRQLGWMEESGLVRRFPDPSDRRRYWVEMTADTQQVMRKLIDSFCEPINTRQPAAGFAVRPSSPTSEQ